MFMSKLIPIAFPAGMISLSPTSQQQTTLDGLPSTALESSLGNTYTFYAGNGTTEAGWPSMDQWVDFYSMWEHNEGLMNISCSAVFNVTRDNSMTENEDILDAIGAESDKTGIDRRFILAIIMQESKGCVRVHTTSSPGASVTNPGLMQTHNGLGTCASVGNATTPCGPVMISQMVKDGVQGTSAGDGLLQCWNKSPGSSAEQYYAAARMYNSGAIDGSGDLGAGCCTHCYASDVANRLTGWVNATSACTLDNDS